MISATAQTVDLTARVFSYLLTGVLCMLLLGIADASEVKTGDSYGARLSETPDWFKESFLEFEEDVAEAASTGKRVLLYFHQEGCPYCARLVGENFSDPAIKAYMQQHFDSITINMWGDREVISVGGQNFTEKTFAAAFRVQYTPTVIFLDEQGKVALRLDGYYPPAEFQSALRYVADHENENISFGKYFRAEPKQQQSQLLSEDFFQQRTDLDQLANSAPALAVYFESSDCDACVVMHEKILSDRTTRDLVVTMNNVQLDIYSDQTVTTPEGRQTTASAWANDLDIAYTPSVVFFDTEGKEVMRMSAFLKTFHFQSVYAYVLEKAYLQQPSFQRFIALRAEQIREAGFDTDIYGYKSAH